MNCHVEITEVLVCRREMNWKAMRKNRITHPITNPKNGFVSLTSSASLTEFFPEEK